MGFKIITWNINGLRSFGGKDNWLKIFKDFQQPELLCFQETKISRESMLEWMYSIDGYTSYFNFPNLQDSSSTLSSSSSFSQNSRKSGYSGVATFCSEGSSESESSENRCCFRPQSIELSLLNNGEDNLNDYGDFDESKEDLKFWSKWSQDNLKVLDNFLLTTWDKINSEGRCIISKHRIEIQDQDDHRDHQNDNDKTKKEQKWLFLFNLYCPRNDPNRLERQIFQLKFYHLLQKRVEEILSNPNNHVILVGDFNTAHKPIDVYEDEEFCYQESYSRKWFDNFLNLNFQCNDNNSGTNATNKRKRRKLFDAFRLKQPFARNQFTCWNTQVGGRETNYGSRIDYILIDDQIASYLDQCYHLTEYKGSDHCPVVAKFNNQIKFLKPNPSEFYSKYCTKFWLDQQLKMIEKNSIKKYFQIKDRKQLEEKEEELHQEPIKCGNNNKRIKSSTTSSSQMKISNFLTGRLSQKNFNDNIDDDNGHENQIDSIDSIDSSAPAAIDDDNDTSSSSSSQNNNPNEISEKWRQLFTQKIPKIPLCRGHNLPCIRKKVQKPGKNFGREYFICSKPSLKPEGHPETKCQFFQWISSSNSNSSLKKS